MIKLIIFDLDGVLIDSREIHFESMNRALIQTGYNPISVEEHLAKYDGLSTTKKLELLNKTRGVKEADFTKIWVTKQQHTVDLYDEKLTTHHKLIDFLDWLKKYYSDIKVGVASNSIFATMRQALHNIGVLHRIDKIVSNEDVKNVKPFPEMYWQIMTHFKITPQETLILEDSHIGRKAALSSGAQLFPVENADDLDYNALMNLISAEQAKAEQSSYINCDVPWIDKKLNILVPMAGGGTRFAKAGYTFPKPLIEVHGKPMIQIVVENLNIKGNYIFVVQKEHYDRYNLKYLLNLIAPDCKIVQVAGITEGAACTTLLAEEHINNDNPLLICNSDQFIEWNSNECMYAFSNEKIDGGVLTFKATHPRWSYVRIDETDGFIKEVAEKKIISDNATVGIYYWKHGKNYVRSVYSMMQDDTKRVNGEWYVAPSINELLNEGQKFRPKTVDKMWSLGIPEDLKFFLENYHGRV